MMDKWFKRTSASNDDPPGTLELQVNELTLHLQDRDGEVASLVDKNVRLAAASQLVRKALAETQQSVGLLRQETAQSKQEMHTHKAQLTELRSQLAEAQSQLNLSEKKRIREKQRRALLTTQVSELEKARDAEVTRAGGLEVEIEQLAEEVVNLNSRVEHAEAECRRSDASFLRSSSDSVNIRKSDSVTESAPRVSVSPFIQESLSPCAANHRVLLDTISVASRALSAALAEHSHLAATMGFEGCTELLPAASKQVFSLQDASPKIHNHLSQLGILDSLSASQKDDIVQVQFRLSAGFHDSDRTAVSQWVGAQILSAYSTLCARSYEVSDISGGPNEFHCTASSHEPLRT